MRTAILIILLLLCFHAYSQQEVKGTTPETLLYINLFNTKNDTTLACYRIPSLVTATNGDLIAAIDMRVPSCADLKWNDDINIVIRRSMDNGDTWSEIETVIDYPIGQSASDPSMVVDRTTGIVFMFYNFMDLEKEKDVYYFKVVTSLDHGKSWSKPKDITSQITKPDWQNDFKFITSGSGIQTQSGKLLHTIVNLEKGLHVFCSDNHGKSWYLIDSPIKPADESKIAELTGDTLMITSRVNDAGIRYKHFSFDQGVTWSTMPDSSLIDPGCNASILCFNPSSDNLDMNWILISNVRSKNKREDLTISLSFDNGRSWPISKTIYVGSAAYSSLCILKNGDFGLFFEANNYEDNFFVKFDLDWLMDGK